MKWIHALSSMSLLAAVFMAPAHAQDAEMQEALKDCDRNQMTMNMCASHRYAEADKALNNQYKKTMAKQASDQARKRVRDAQRAWIVFRDKDCLADTGPRDQGGSMWPLQHYSCMENLTLRRVEDLKRQACGMEGCAEGQSPK